MSINLEAIFPENYFKRDEKSEKEENHLKIKIRIKLKQKDL